MGGQLREQARADHAIEMEELSRTIDQKCTKCARSTPGVGDGATSDVSPNTV
jgi:hypothetical protein